jgi:hypothetical protein
MRWVSSFFCNRENIVEHGEEITMFSGLPQTVSNFQAFTNGIRGKLGLLILYTERDSGYLEALVQTLRSQEYVIEILVYRVLIVEGELYSLLFKSIEFGRSKGI